MIAAIDTNTLLDILLPNPKFCDASMHVVQEAASVGSLVICDLVHALWRAVCPRSSSACAANR